MTSNCTFMLVFELSGPNLVSIPNFSSISLQMADFSLCFGAKNCEVPGYTAKQNNERDNALYGGIPDSPFAVGKYNHMTSLCSKFQVFWLKNDVIMTQ